MTIIANLLEFVMRISMEEGSLSSAQNGPPPLSGQGEGTLQSSSSLKSSVLHSVQKTLQKVATHLKCMSHSS